jgi:hypothetical protein
MDTIIKEYGSFLAAIIGALFGFTILVLCVFTFKGQSKEMIADMTGVQYVEYVDEGD